MATVCPIGKKFERLTVVGLSHIIDATECYKWVCQCDCGKVTHISRHSLRQGKTRSCGCLRDETVCLTNAARATHGHTRNHKPSRTYKSWQSIFYRIKDDPNYKDVKVTSRWNKFENFLADMGDRPPRTTIDRISNYKPYSKNNCRWATTTQQARNKTNNRLHFFKGKTRTLAEIAEMLNMRYGTLHQRIDSYGWTFERATTTPVRKW